MDHLAKSEILTFCQRRQLEAPRLVVDDRGSGVRATVSLSVAGRTAEGHGEGATVREAETRAFVALLSALAKLDDAPLGTWVTAAREAELRRTNPKTRLLTLLQQRGLPAPVFETVAVLIGCRNAFEGTAVLELPDGTDVCAPLSLSGSAVVAEQASADALLADARVRALLVRTPDMIPTHHARALLQHVEAEGHVREVQIAILRAPTPAVPLFVAQGAWVDTNGERHVTEPVEAPGKKGAEALAARAILEALRAVGTG